MTTFTRRERIQGYIGLCAEVEEPIRMNMLKAMVLDEVALEQAGACRRCGCSDRDCSECVERTGEPCWWVEADLCSACATPEEIAEAMAAVTVTSTWKEA